jgi:hypothetical protein
LHVGKVIEWKQRGGLQRQDFHSKDQRNLKKDQARADADEQVLVMNKDQSEVLNRDNDDLNQYLEVRLHRSNEL